MAYLVVAAAVADAAARAELARLTPSAADQAVDLPIGIRFKHVKCNFFGGQYQTVRRNRHCHPSLSCNDLKVSVKRKLSYSLKSMLLSKDI